MGEAARRRARVMRLVGTRRVPLAEFEKMPSGCAWDGCDASFTGDMPPGWVWMLAYWRQKPAVNFYEVGDNDQRDCALCPKHWTELELLLRPLPDKRLLGKNEGRAQ